MKALHIVIFISFFTIAFVSSGNAQDTAKLNDKDISEFEDLEKIEESDNGLTFEGELYTDYAHSIENKDHLLDPFGKFIDDPVDIYRGMLNTRFQYTPLSSSNLTFTFDNYLIGSYKTDEDVEKVNKNNYKNIVTELYMAYNFNSYGILLGKKNIVEGTAYFKNPTNYLGKKTDIAGINRDQKMLIKTRQGNILVGFEKLWENSSFSINYIPQLKGDSIINLEANEEHEIQSKLTFLILDSDINLLVHRKNISKDGITDYGFSFARVFTDELELHSEMSYRYDHPMQTLEKKEISMPPNFSTTAPQWQVDAKRHLFQVVVGGQYTFSDATFLEQWNVTSEYYYQNEGWNNKQWDTYFNELDNYNLLKKNNPVFGLYEKFGGENLSRLNNSTGFQGQHYLFLRLAKDDLFRWLDFSVFSIISLQDFSSNIGAELLKVFAESFQVKVIGNIFTGQTDSEFGQMPLLGSVQISFSYLF